MPICPECKSAHLEQHQNNFRKFKCSDCGGHFILVKNEAKP